MKRLTKLVAALLIAAFTVTAFAACGDSKEDKLYKQAQEDHSAYIREVADNTAQAIEKSVKPVKSVKQMKDGLKISVIPGSADGAASPLFGALTLLIKDKAGELTIETDGQSAKVYFDTTDVILDASKTGGDIYRLKTAEVLDVLKNVVGNNPNLGSVVSFPNGDSLSSDKFNKAVDQLREVLRKSFVQTVAKEETTINGKTVNCIVSRYTLPKDKAGAFVGDVIAALKNLAPEAFETIQQAIQKVGIQMTCEAALKVDAKTGLLAAVTADIGLKGHNSEDDAAEAAVTCVVELPENGDFANPANVKLEVVADRDGEKTTNSFEAKWEPNVNGKEINDKLTVSVDINGEKKELTATLSYNKETKEFAISLFDAFKAEGKFDYSDSKVELTVDKIAVGDSETKLDGLNIVLETCNETPVKPQDGQDVTVKDLISLLLGDTGLIDNNMYDHVALH